MKGFITMTDCSNNTIIDNPCEVSSGLPVGTDSGIAGSCNFKLLDNVVNGNEDFYYNRVGKKVKSLAGAGLAVGENIVSLDSYKSDSNSWNDALELANQSGWGVLFPKDGLVTLNELVNVYQTDKARVWLLNGCRVEFMADGIVDCDHFAIRGAGTIYLNTTVVTANKGRLTFTENVKFLDVEGDVDFEGDLKIAQLDTDMVGPTNVMTLKSGHNFEVGRHVSSSWNNNKLPNSPSLIPEPNKGDESFLNRAETIVGNVVTLSYDIVAYTIPQPAYIFQNTRFDRDFIRILGNGTYRFTDVTFNNSPSYMIGMRDDTQQARIFMDNVQAYNYAIDGFVMKCKHWSMKDCKFGQQFDAAKSLAVVQMPKDGLLHWSNVESKRGNGDGEIFVFGVNTSPKITLENCDFDGENMQPFPKGVYNSPAPANGNAIGIYDCLHPFVTSSDGVVEEEYDCGAFTAKDTNFFNYQRAIFSTTYVQRKRFSFDSCTIDNCQMDCSPTYFNIEELDESSLGPVNISNSKIKASTYSLNAIHDNVVTYENCEIYVDNSDPQVVQDGAPVRLENVKMFNCSLRGWWVVRANSNVILRDVGLHPKEGLNDTTLSIQDPFFAYKQNNFILLNWSAETTNSFIEMREYFGGNAIGSNFAPNSPFKVPFRIEGSNVDFETSNEFFFSAQAGVVAGNESYRANLYRERVGYPPLPTSGATSLYVPINSMLNSNIDNVTELVTDRSRAVVTVGGLQESDQFSISLSRSGIDGKVAIGDFIGVYYAAFDTVYWYRITALTLTSEQNFDLTIDRFPISGGTTGIFQDISVGDEAYWIKTGDNEAPELPVGYGAKLTATGIAGDEISAGFTNLFFTGSEYDDSSGEFYADPPFIKVPDGMDRVDLSGIVIYPSNSVESSGYYQLQIAQYTAANTFIRLVADSGKCVVPVNATDITVNINAIGVNMNDGDYFVMRGRGTAFTINPQPFTSAAITIKKAK